MKTKFLKIGLKKAIALVFAGMLVSTVYGQRRSGYCVNNIPGLTDEQKNKIEQLITVHQKEMDELSSQKRSAAFDKKNEFNTLMDEKRNAHHNNVRALLTDEQIKLYNEYHAQDSRQQGKNYGKGKYRGKGKGYGQKNGKGQGQKKGNGLKDGSCRN